MKQLQCLCQICTCGRHYCPHNPTRIYDQGEVVNFLSEYADKYPVYGNVPPPQSLKPQQQHQSNGGKMEGTSTFRADYRPYEVANRPVRAREVYKPKPGEIDLGTTYRRDYNAHKVQPVALLRPVERNYVRGEKLNTLPTYRDDYRAWDVQKVELHKAPNTYHPPMEKFGNTTTFQDAFFPKEISIQKSFKPGLTIRLSDQPFNAMSSHRSDYVPHPLEPRFKIPRDEYKPHSQPFDNTTTHRCDFRGLVGEVPKSCKPDQQVAPKGQFEGLSEFRERFQPWPVSLPEVHKAKEYIPPTGSMDLNTTSHLDYVHHDVSPIVLMKPLQRSTRNTAPFMGTTTMRDAFQAWEACRPEAIKKVDALKPSGKFDGRTTFRDHYVPHNVPPVLSCRPPRMPLSSSVPFEDQSMYRTEYTPKKQEICPAAYASPLGYEFVNSDSGGHKFFRRMSSDIPNIAQENGKSFITEVACNPHIVPSNHQSRN
ncbi:stabilizer of axonemal microtubules 2 [Anolis carolinensis]|uniref:stabilizer of axonemal microtubules 2 n=1 Tax=Anolis carolinensis TaxID=28377 RepID=UPI000203AB02